MSGESDNELEDKMSDNSNEEKEKKNEESNEKKNPIQMSMLMTSNPLPRNNMDKKNILPSQDNIEKKNENEQLNDLENNLYSEKKFDENMENKNNTFIKKEEKKEEIKEEKKEDKKEEKKEEKIEEKEKEKEEKDESEDDIPVYNSEIQKNSKNKKEFMPNVAPKNQFNSMVNNNNNRPKLFENKGNFRGGNRNFGDNNNYMNRRNNNFNFMNYQNNNENDNNIKNDPFYITNKEIIMDIKSVFSDLEDFEILKIIKLIYLNDSRTIFEIMNMIKREYTIINTLKEVKNKNDRQYQGIFDINEMNYEEDIQSFHEEIIASYKVTNKKENESEWNYQNEYDKRRELIKDTEGFYNYLPILGDDNNINSDIYARNNNEILYHSLMYKTIICRNKKCSNNLCPYAHNLGEDLRLIYDYQKEDICMLMLKLMKCKILHIENYLEHFEIPTKFNLDDFKILKCKLGKDCLKDPHLCYCYHNKEEIRRPPKLFRYINKRCEYAQKNPKSEYKPELCPYGIFCHYLHSKVEFNYHVKNFRKVFKCTRKKEKGICIYYDTCYGKHDSIKVNNNNNNIIIDDDDEKNESNIEINKEIKEYEEKIKKIEDVIKIFFCKKCGSTPPDYVIFVLKCNDLFCKNCIKDCFKEEKCFKCKNVIEKNSVMKLDFGLKK